MADSNQQLRPVVVISAVVFALGAVWTIALVDRPAEVRISDLTREYHEHFRSWRPADGVRSPRPLIHNELNVALLDYYGLQFAEADRVVAVTGPPLAIYRNREYPAITYWQTDSHWVTMAPGCQMLSPRNPQYDAMMAQSMETDAFKVPMPK